MNGKDEKQTVITVPCTKAQRHIFYVHAKKKGRLFTAWCLDALGEKLKSEANNE